MVGFAVLTGKKGLASCQKGLHFKSCVFEKLKIGILISVYLLFSWNC